MLKHNCKKLKTASMRELRKQSKDMSYEEREQLFADALDLTNLESAEACLLAVVQRCYREDRGLDTPIEKFVCSCLGHFLFRAPDFEDVRRDMDELRLDWDDALDIAKNFYADYRELVTCPASDSASSNNLAAAGRQKASTVIKAEAATAG